MGSTKLSGPGRLGSIKQVKKSLKGGAQSMVRNIPKEDSLTVRFLRNPEDWHGYYEHWLADGPKPCVADDCEGCGSDDEKERKRNFRYLAPAYVVDDQKVRALKLPKTLVEQLVNFYQKYKGTLLDRDYELSRTGSGQNDTRYMAAPDAPSKKNLSRFEDQIPDLEETLQAMVSDEEDDDDEPVSKKKSGKKSKSKPAKSQKNPWDDDDEDEPRSKKKKKSASKTVAKKTVAKKKPPVKRKVRR